MEPFRIFSTPILTAITALLWSSCAPPVVTPPVATPPVVTPPVVYRTYSEPPPKMNTLTVLLEQDYDTVWRALIDHVSQSSFSIDNFEKDSGLITLTFSVSPETYVNCGHLNTQETTIPYVQWLQGITLALQERGRDAFTSLSGKMNISVYKMTKTITRVRVNARYILTYAYYSEVKGFGFSETWTFDSGSSASILVSKPVRELDKTNNSIRTCRPTYQAESDILDAVKAFSENT